MFPGRPETSSIDISFPEIEKPVRLCQLKTLNDAGLIWNLLQYVLREYQPGGGLEMRASMYTNMLPLGATRNR